MPWAPTEGLRRARKVLDTLLEDSAHCDLELRDPVFQPRVLQLIGEAIDRALQEGPPKVSMPVRFDDDEDPASDAEVVDFMDSLVTAAEETAQADELRGAEPAPARAKKAKRGRGRPPKPRPAP